MEVSRTMRSELETETVLSNASCNRMEVLQYLGGKTIAPSLHQKIMISSSRETLGMVHGSLLALHCLVDPLHCLVCCLLKVFRDLIGLNNWVKLEAALHQNALGLLLFPGLDILVLLLLQRPPDDV